ncbi:MAG: hypothetical protein ACYTAS_16115, partial [Planctomycetota bacterium]
SWGVVRSHPSILNWKPRFQFTKTARLGIRIRRWFVRKAVEIWTRSRRPGAARMGFARRRGVG